MVLSLNLQASKQLNTILVNDRVLPCIPNRYQVSGLTCFIGMQMHYIYHLNDMDIMVQLQLGKAFSNTLSGPILQAVIA